MKLRKDHIQEQWEDSDGFWIALKSGYKSSEDPIGCLHTIREDTKPEAYAVGVSRCSCVDCKADAKRKALA